MVCSPCLRRSAVLAAAAPALALARFASRPRLLLSVMSPDGVDHAHSRVVLDFSRNHHSVTGSIEYPQLAHGSTVKGV